MGRGLDASTDTGTLSAAAGAGSPAERYHCLMNDDIIRVMSSKARRRPAPVARVLLRLPASLHRSLAKAAAEAGLSVNEYCVRRLAEPEPPAGMASAVLRARVVSAARAAHGERLTGVIAIGSWTRGEAATGSDVDVLLVLDAAIPLTRELYRSWDASAPSMPGRVVDVHFTHPHVPGASPGAVWCEAAVDGQVWFDRDGRIASALADVRRAIAHGRIVRAVVHGQPYWKEVA